MVKSNGLTFFQIASMSSECKGIRLGIDQKNENVILPGRPGFGSVPEGDVKIVSAMNSIFSQCTSRLPGSTRQHDYAHLFCQYLTYRESGRLPQSLSSLHLLRSQ